MILELIVSLVTLACIVAFVVWLAMQPQRRILQIAVPVCVISFVIIYAFYLVARLVPDDPVFGIPAAFSAFVETFGSFTNGVAYSDVAESDRVMNVFTVFWFETLFWALHMLVIISIAISGFAVFGRKFMDKVRYRLHLQFAKESIYFIFGETEGALIFGKNLVEQAKAGNHGTSGDGAAGKDPKPFVVYFSYEYSEELREQIADFGGALIEVSERSRKEYFDQAKETNKDNIVIFEGLVRPMVKFYDTRGYDIAELVARKVVKDHAPYKAMFDEAVGDVHSIGEAQASRLRIPEHPYAAIVIGFGEIGRACLKQLIMTSQLMPRGAKPKFYVISRSDTSFDRFLVESPSVLECADIEFLGADAYSREAARLIDKAVHDEDAPVRHVYVCCAPVQAATPEEGMAFRDMNKEVIRYLEDLFRRIAPSDACSSEASRDLFVNPCKEEREIWSPDIILHRGLDKRAMSLNYSYLPKEYQADTTPEEAWDSTGNLDKDSSRAAADFMEAYYALAGIEPESDESKSMYQAILQEEGVLNALAQVEHNRWMAFHYCNGFTKMPKSVFEERAKQEARAKEQHGTSAFCGDDKPHRDTGRKLHPCLVSWEELPALDSIYAVYRGEGCTPLQESDEDSPKKARDFVGK